MTTHTEIRVVRFTDGTIDLEMCEFDDKGSIVAHRPWNQSWFCAFLGGERGELAQWLRDQIVNAFQAGFTNAVTASWMADSTTMVEKENLCTTLALLSSEPPPVSS